MVTGCADKRKLETIVFRCADDMRRDMFRCADDARVDYDSLLDSDQRRSRFSEELLDTELRESVMLGKMYRELQRQINCR